MSADRSKHTLPPLALIGASAGGPQVLGDMLKLIPGNAPFAVVIAQHIECDFMGDFINWLSRYSQHTCMLAAESEKPRAGGIYLAGCHSHLVFDRMGRFLYEEDEGENASPYRPGIDQLFDSAAKWWPKPGVAALLTGMGSDGAQGLLRLREKGWQTIAQDQTSSLVYGMPKAAAELNAAQKIMEPENIIRFIIKTFC